MIKVTTNINEVLSKILAKTVSLQQGELKDGLVRIAATTQLSMMQTRIHEEGKAADGGDIGQYSSKPLYVSKEANPGKSFGRPLGKVNKAGKQYSKFQGGKKKGQDHKSRYFAGGYKEYRSAIGRRSDKVDLSLSGQLGRQLTIIAAAGGYGIGWADAEKKKRAEALTKKYKKRIWYPTKEETEVIKKVVETELHKQFNS